MKIAIVAPLYESVPPKLYGGTERVVSFLAEELVHQGHEVTLFAAGDSLTTAQLVAISPESLRLNKNCIDQLAWHILMIAKVYRQADDFDLIHFHIDYLHFPMSRHSQTPHVTTMHGRLDIPDIAALHREFVDIPLVSISFAQRKPIPWAHWVGNVYHGLPKANYHFSNKPGTHLAFLGRFSPEKGVEHAIEIARQTDNTLLIAAKIDKTDQAYYEEKIKPLLSDPRVEYIGEINEHEKGKLLGSAKALLFPICWPEPFGLVMIESLAYGTPVISYGCGSVPEIIEPGKNGFIVNSVEAAATAVRNIMEIDRSHCRKIFEERFSVEIMANNYLNVYQSLITQKCRVSL